MNFTISFDFSVLLSVLGVSSVVLLALVRLLLLRKPVRQSYGDEDNYVTMGQIVADSGPRALRAMGAEWLTDPLVQHKPPPQRVAYLWLMGILLAITDNKKREPKERLRQKFRIFAWVATLSGVLTVFLAAAIGYLLGDLYTGVASGLVIGTCPLLLGLGRRALLDVPSVLCQLSVIGGALLGPQWWPLVASLTTLALLTRESTRSALWGLLVAVSWLWGWNWALAGQALGCGVVGWMVLLKLATGIWPWRFPSCFGLWIRRRPKQEYAVRFCQGGVHRLLVDLLLVSPVVVISALLWGDTNPLALAAMATLSGYSLPWLDQQIRSAMLVDLLLRLTVALVAPWWALAAVLVCDLYIYWRLWWRTWDAEGNQLYDPTTNNLIFGLGITK